MYIENLSRICVYITPKQSTLGVQAISPLFLVMKSDIGSVPFVQLLFSKAGRDLIRSCLTTFMGSPVASAKDNRFVMHQTLGRSTATAGCTKSVLGRLGQA
jgi:hypothetical protein